MLIEYLSNHAGDRVREAEDRRRAAEAELADRNRAHEQAGRELEAVLEARSFWRRLVPIPSSAERAARAELADASQQIGRARALVRKRTDDYEQLKAGVDGERRVEQWLAPLSDEWVLLRGYQNQRGETDGVLIGPRGVWVIEVKANNARLHVDGDDWWYERFDRRGRLVARKKALDGSGRTWGRQVNDVADALGAWLARRGHDLPIRTAVVLSLDNAGVVECRNSGVDVVGSSAAELLDAIADSTGALSAVDRLDVVELIRRDHRFHEQRRAGP